MQKELQQLLLDKDVAAARAFLENLPRNEKGPAFEQFLEELYNGNGYKAVRQGGKGDGGADILLYEPTEEGIFCIIQVKNESKPLTVDKTVTELNKFETKASSKYGCNEFEIVSMNGFVKDAKELSRFRLNLRDWEHVARLIKSYDPDSESVPHIRLHAHNQNAFDAVMEGIEEGNKVACVQATGTGKSYVIGAVMNQFADQHKLLLAPSKYIINQQSQVARWLNPSTEYKTYQSLPQLHSDEIKALNPSLIVLDEFHRTGAERWGEGVEKVLEAFPDAKVLGTTATPIRYLDEQRDMSDELFDMEAVNLPLAEAIQRRILPSPTYISSLYTLREEADALREDLKKSQRTDAEKEVIKDEIDRAVIDWEKTSGVAEILKKYLSDRTCKKFVVFCKDIEHLNELEDEVRKWFRKTGLFEDRESYRVYSGYKKSDANYKRFLAADDDSTAHILLAVDMLNEGIHASDIDAVLLFRPTISPRIFYQQIGRCLQVGSKNNPLIFDFVNNFQSIRANDFLKDLEEASEKEREIRSRFGLNEEYVPNIHVHDESKEVLEFFAKIESRLGVWETRFEELDAYKADHGDCLVPLRYEHNKSLGIWVQRQRASYKDGKLSDEKTKRLNSIKFDWDPLETQWISCMERLRKYKKTHGNCRVPQTFKEDPELASWVANQRNYYKTQQLPDHRLEALEQEGFSWDPYEDKWFDRFEELKSFYEKNRHHLVSDRRLANWIVKQRKQKKDGLLSDARIEKLNGINLDWDPIGNQWRKMFDRLFAFYRKHKHCSVSTTSRNNEGLSVWVSTQRYNRKKGILDDEKIKALNEIDFAWDVLDARWDEQYAALIEYKADHGDCLVPLRYEHNKSLGIWVQRQRTSYKDGKLDSRRYQRLIALGFEFRDRHTAFWESRFDELSKYHQQHKHCRVSRSDEANTQLGDWVATQRKQRKKGKLTNEQIEKLNGIGFLWDPIEDVWQERYEELVIYREKHGDCRVPQKYDPNPQLGVWVSVQRASQKDGNLSTEKYDLLEKIGFKWRR